MSALPLPLPVPIPETNRKKGSLRGMNDGAEAVEVLVEELGDVDGMIVVLQCAFAARVMPLYAEYLIARLLNLGAERIELVYCRDEHWPKFVAAAERLGVPDRIRRTEPTRLVGAK
jgi:hypothetical protein